MENQINQSLQSKQNSFIFSN